MGRIGTTLAAAVAALVGLVLVSFALPIGVWRTGELPPPPLPLIEGGPAVVMAKRVWIDTDAACGHSPMTDPDDCFALLLLARSGGIHIAGVSTVHGNAALEVTDRITRELVAMLEREGAEVGHVHRGAYDALDASAPEAATPAQRALRHALDQGPVTIVALGPLTNIAAALAGRPDLQRNVARLVVVMGRTPGHLFHPSEGAGGGMLFGHGPVFRDFNFDQDRNAAARILAMDLPMTLVPYVAARQVSLTGTDLSLLGADAGSAAWVAARARDWLAFWETDVGRNGFYPFDVLAAVYTLRPDLFTCAQVKAVVARDKELWDWIYGPEALLVGPDSETGETASDARAAAGALYCPQFASGLHEWIMSRLEKREPGS